MQPTNATPLTTRELRRFALAVGPVFVLLAVVAWWRGREATAAVLLVPGALLSVAGLVAPSRLGPVHRAWLGLARAISMVTTPIFMGVVYFVVLTPIGLAMRLLGRHPLGRPRRGESAWVERPDGERRSDLRRQF